MSAQANVTAFDGAATPVAHAFTAAGVSNDAKRGMLAEWQELLASVPTDYRPYMSFSKKKLPSGVYRIEISVATPIMEAIAGQNASGYTAAPKLAHRPAGSGVFYFDPRATLAERRLVRQLLVNVLGGIATTVTPVTTGNVSELIDGNLFPS